MKDQILSHLGAGHIWAGSIRYYPTIDSTNTEAKKLAEAGAPHGTVLIADHQTKGRGRMGNTFHSPKDAGIYLSVILRPDCPATKLSHLTCAAGVAMCDALKDSIGIRPSVKWINDLVFQGRKLGGILTELSLSAQGMVRYAVVGIGINCNQKITDFPPDLQNIVTTTAEITGQSVDRSLLIANMIKGLEEMSRCLFSNKKELMAQYRCDCITIGQEIAVLKADEKYYGTALDIDEEGALLVRDTNGCEHWVNSGEVHVRGLYGYC